jgi:hypothetical protein
MPANRLAMVNSLLVNGGVGLNSANDRALTALVLTQRIFHGETASKLAPKMRGLWEQVR